MRQIVRRSMAVIVTLAFMLVPAAAFASPSPTLNQTVNAGALSTDIYQAGDTSPVTSPTVAFSAVNRSFSCQTATATLGDSNNLINVTNFAVNNGWTLAIAATGGYTSTWTSGTNTYKFNDNTGSGCTNGDLTVNPAAATLTDDCNSTCTNTNVTQGVSTAFNHATSVDSVTLLSDSSGTAWEGYITGVGLSQAIPAAQASGSYSLGMTITVTAQ